jgi:uncharacterized membrane protein
MKTFFRWLLAAFMTFTGTMHFVRAQPFVDIVPSFLPYPLALVYISGFFEVLFGIGLLIPRFSRYAAWGLIALYVAVFPANVNMAVNQMPFMGTVHPVGNWVRLPFQLVLILWAYWLTKRDGGKLD